MCRCADTQRSRLLVIKTKADTELRPSKTLIRYICRIKTVVIVYVYWFDSKSWKKREELERLILKIWILLSSFWVTCASSKSHTSPIKMKLRFLIFQSSFCSLILSSDSYYIRY